MPKMRVKWELTVDINEDAKDPYTQAACQALIEMMFGDRKAQMFLVSEESGNVLPGTSTVVQGVDILRLEHREMG